MAPGPRASGCWWPWDRTRRPSGWCAPASAWPIGLDAEWLVVYVETPDLIRLSEAERNRRIAILRLAASLGAEAITLGGSSAGAELLEYARTRNVTRILVGRPQPRRAGGGCSGPRPPSSCWRPARHRRGGDRRRMTRRRAAGAADARYSVLTPSSDKRRWPRYLLAVAATLAATALCCCCYGYFPHGSAQANLVMIYLLSHRAGGGLRRPARGDPELGARRRGVRFHVRAAALFTFAVSDVQYLLTFAIMLGVALIIGNLNASVRLQARVAGLPRAAHGTAVCDDAGSWRGARPRRDGRGGRAPCEPGI